MSNFAMLRFSDQITVVLAVFIVVAAVVTMVVVGSESLRNWFRKMFVGVLLEMEAVADKWFSDDEEYNPEWMEREAWERTRIPR